MNTINLPASIVCVFSAVVMSSDHDVSPFSFIIFFSVNLESLKLLFNCDDRIFITIFQFPQIIFISCFFFIVVALI